MHIITANNIPKTENVSNETCILNATALTKFFAHATILHKQTLV